MLNNIISWIALFVYIYYVTHLYDFCQVLEPADVCKATVRGTSWFMIYQKILYGYLLTCFVFRVLCAKYPKR